MDLTSLAFPIAKKPDNKSYHRNKKLKSIFSVSSLCCKVRINILVFECTHDYSIVRLWVICFDCRGANHRAMNMWLQIRLTGRGVMLWLQGSILRNQAQNDIEWAFGRLSSNPLIPLGTSLSPAVFNAVLFHPFHDIMSHRGHFKSRLTCLLEIVLLELPKLFLFSHFFFFLIHFFVLF